MGYDLMTRNPTLTPPDPSDPEDEYWEYYDRAWEAGDVARFNWTVWPRLLALAKSYGWQPAGAIPNPEKGSEGFEPADIDETYLFNCGQVVTAADAAALAEALERLLPDLPDHDIEGKLTNLSSSLPTPLEEAISRAIAEKEGGQEGDHLILGPNPEMSAFEYFGGAMKGTVIHFIQFCRKGEFEIW